MDEEILYPDFQKKKILIFFFFNLHCGQWNRDFNIYIFTSLILILLGQTIREWYSSIPRGVKFSEELPSLTQHKSQINSNLITQTLSLQRFSISMYQIPIYLWSINFYKPYLWAWDKIAIAMFSFDQFYWAEKRLKDQQKWPLMEIKARSSRQPHH